MPRARNACWWLAICAVALLSVACSGPPDPTRPNIVLLIADDQAYDDFGFMGSEHVLTPNLDRLAAEGTLFTLAHNTASLCKPSLATLLTGLHPYQIDRAVDKRIGGPDARHAGHRMQNLRLVLDVEALVIRSLPTLPRVLAERGYASFQGGKYWYGSYETGGFTTGMTPERTPGEQAVRFEQAGREGVTLGRTTMEPLVEFLDDHGDEPFLLWVAPMLPHMPFDAPRRFQRLYHRRPYSRQARHYYANCTRLDAFAGELMELLEQRGLRENTLVVFLSDNGWDQRPHADHQSTLGGPRGKASVYDLGFRTPIVFHWPGVVPRGRVVDALVSTVDVFPTILDYAGVETPPKRPGRSLRPLIEGRATHGRDAVIGGMDMLRGPDDAPLYERTFYVRTRDWHYVSFEDGGRELLFDLRTDPEENVDVSLEHPDRIAGFRAKIEAWRRNPAQPPPPFAGGPGQASAGAARAPSGSGERL